MDYYLRRDLIEATCPWAPENHITTQESKERQYIDRQDG